MSLFTVSASVLGGWVGAEGGVEELKSGVGLALVEQVVGCSSAARAGADCDLWNCDCCAISGSFYSGTFIALQTPDF